MSLADDLEKRIGQKTDKGTRITQGVVDAVRSDEAELQIIADNTDAIIEEIGGAILNGLYKVGEAAETHAKALSPVDTGRLRNSITFVIDPDKSEVYIGTNVEYAPYQENGTSRMRAANGGRGFLRPAANDYASEYREIFRSCFTDA